MIEALVALYFSVGLILVSVGPVKVNIAREVDKVRDFKPNLRALSMPPPAKKIMLFRLIITAGFIVMWPFLLPGALKDNQRSADIALFNNLKRSFKGKKFKCPKCHAKEAVQILYGYPREDTLQAWFKKDVELGGCIVGNEKPTHKCFKCGHQW